MKLYVGNLDFQTTSQDLQELFSQAGTVQSANIITDRDTGRSRGFGFVEMESHADASKAMKGLNNTEIEGRAIAVTVAREKSPRQDNKRW